MKLDIQKRDPGVKALPFLLFLACITLPVFGGGGGEVIKPAPEPAGAVTEAVTPIDSQTDYFPYKTKLYHADGFSVEYHNTYKYVRVSEPFPNAQRGFNYLLLQRGAPLPEGYGNAIVITIPVRSFVSLSTSFLGGLDMLGVMNTLTAVDNIEYIYNAWIRARIQEYKILEAAKGATPDIELLLGINPDCIMASAIGSSMDVHPKLLEVNLPIVINGEWNEKSPLGRAEWIKFISLFFNKEEEADLIFSSIEQQYSMIRNAARASKEYPTVFTGAPYEDVWYMPGGNSYAARFFADAGATYLWSETVATGSLALDFESVFYKAVDADYWLNAGFSNESLDEMLQSDERFAGFMSFQNGEVYASNNRTVAKGGNDYWESGILNPHVILADLVKIFHPEILPEHELFYYRKLE